VRKASSTQIENLLAAASNNILEEGIDGVDTPYSSTGTYVNS